MAEIKLWGALRPSVGGQASIEVDAKTIRELMRKLGERYPGMQSFLDAGVAVSIDGTIYRDNWDQKLPEGAEIYLLPRIEGG